MYKYIQGKILYDRYKTLVYRARNADTHEDVVIKKIHIDRVESIAREVFFLDELEHSNIIKLIEHVIEGEYYYIVLESFPGNLHKYVAMNPLQNDVIKKITLNILLAIKHCHDYKVIHRDIKTKNILINDITMQVKLCDFGHACDFSEEEETMDPGMVTLNYRPPEILLGSTNYNQSIDIWSLGCVIVEMVNGQVLFVQTDEFEAEVDMMVQMSQVIGVPTRKIWKGFFDFKASGEILPYLTIKKRKALFTEQISSKLFDLVLSMLCWNPSKRITASEALKHPYFNIK